VPLSLFALLLGSYSWRLTYLAPAIFISTGIDILQSRKPSMRFSILITRLIAGAPRAFCPR
jgi:hypothetical protein